MSEKNVALAGDAARHMFFAAEGCVSRKADFVPPLVEAFDDGWCVDDAPDDNQEIVDTVIVVEETPECPGGKFVRRKSVADGVTQPLVFPMLPAEVPAAA